MKNMTFGCVLRLVRSSVARSCGSSDGQQLMPPERMKLCECPLDSLERIELALALEQHFALGLPENFLVERGSVTLNGLAHEIHFMLPSE